MHRGVFLFSISVVGLPLVMAYQQDIVVAVKLQQKAVVIDIEIPIYRKEQRQIDGKIPRFKSRNVEGGSSARLAWVQ